MCWVAADRGARLASMRGEFELAASWRDAADEMHADVCTNGVDERGVFSSTTPLTHSTRRCCSSR
jgi:alpha,alpha-trehalase